VADLLLQALVAQDENLWIEQLQLDQFSESVKELHMRRFNDLQSQLQAALAQDGGVNAIWRLTEQLVCTEVFVDVVNAKAADILGSVAGLEIEKPMRATQFGGTSSNPAAKAHGKSPLGQPATQTAPRRFSGGPTQVSGSPTEEDGIGFDEEQDAGDDLGFAEDEQDMGPGSGGPDEILEEAADEGEDFGESF